MGKNAEFLIAASTRISSQRRNHTYGTVYAKNFALPSADAW